ncbi:TPA: autotransporter outer membrane beta-barrel domain-containing protein [Klebsiella aerogenes]|uniref:autotransporter family protein n=1 Tax=Klebsiella aerogenes TaxID=548 RepID=UPI0019024A0D|nr:autotransporter outer membrane beta-barrel domain-containing protein [Klebsiella aerogenes]EKU6674793.1 autotransporter outer membrane beta-barrel domain-containing protein [Klebsiella aerogenes]EKX4411276.1 autotransporter outer membrane beta-barrel domain-containing protein [Klebsiella aerogenes]EKZ6362037.1 autotransporter outer membrane beta-barrel domain-containing protein [Klebsiella aerogenes]HBR6942209.1 autotransporter outer membrane beta-barrel domain-containing protein [Klebsiella
MSNKHFELNRTTKTLARIFPTLLMVTPIVVSAATIDQSTSVPQDFSADTEYVINRDVTVSSTENTPAVSVSGMNVKKITNDGNISGMGIGLDINIDGQSVEINNNENAIISSETDNAVNMQSMAGTFNNSGIITGANNGIFISEESSAISITNTDTGVITGKNGLSSQIAVGLDNIGAITGTAGDGIALSDGNSKINNSGTVRGSQNGIHVVDSAKADIINSGLLGGGGAAVMFASSKNNSLVLNTGSSLIGDVISTGSAGNALSLVGSGSEDSNFVGLNDGDGFASVKMNGENWTLTGNLDIIGSGDSLQVNSGQLTLAGAVANSGNTLVAEAATLQLGNGQKTATLTGSMTNNGTLIFNQGSDSTFATSIIGSGNVEKVDTNTLTLTGTNSYTGNTLLKSGTTLVAEGATLGVVGSDATLTIDNGAQFASAGEVNNNIDILSGGILAAWNAIEGNSTLRTSGVDTINGNVTNSGTLLLSAADNSVGNNFTINGDYTGSADSQIVMNSQLGEDSSPTDHLSITGSSYGQSGVSIANIGGLGAQTVNGMEIVSVGGSSEAQLTLSKPVVAGAYEYDLYKHSNGNWYLESKATPSDDPSDDTDDGDSGTDDGSGTDNGSSTDNGSGTDSGSDTDNGGQSAPEVMAPEVGAYLGNYLAAQGMFLHKRDDRDQLTFRNEDNLNTWMYVKGRYHENDAGGDKVSYDTTTTVLQVGSDFMSKPMDKGILRAGGMFGAGQAKTDSDAKHNVRDAQGKVDGFNVGLYATWQEDPKLRLGSYIDTWASYSWYNNTVTSNRNNEKYDSKGFAASVEVGHAWVIPSENARTWKIEPQAQMVYSYFDQENHTDPDGVRVTTVDNNSLFGRLGVKSSYFEQQDVKAWQPYVAVNWLKGAGQNDLAFNGEKVSNDTPDDRGQLELGVTGNVNETTTISLRASGEWGENSYAAYGGHILLNHRW